ncbi:Uncharacterized protein DAT39_019803 [Clarias magur]|uniref:Uncharacterized protein n=1 Tax=Clarias magur TaxID=1594786 RepID=A0A8J4WRP3_CLAMG|nr:Uncharacterized protein DAT39_019803 [Clarias magur]
MTLQSERRVSFVCTEDTIRHVHQENLLKDEKRIEKERQKFLHIVAASAGMKHGVDLGSAPGISLQLSRITQSVVSSFRRSGIRWRRICPSLSPRPAQWKSLTRLSGVSSGGLNKSRRRLLRA